MQEMFEKLADRTSELAGRPAAYVSCCLLILVWAATGPIAHFSDTWQLVVNTGTTIITFLMVFLIQSSQNRDTKAIHAKLDALLLATHGANIGIIGVENESEGAMIAKKEQTKQAAISREKR